MRATARHARPPGWRGWVARPGAGAAAPHHQAQPPAVRPRRVPVDPLAGPVAVTERAVLGDQLRRPAVWCEIGSCVSRFGDPAALGEADVRARALAAGWRHDAIGRLVCPACQQRSPQVWARYPPALWAPPPGDHQAASGHQQRGLMTAVRQVVAGWQGNHIRRAGAGTWWPGLLGTLAEGASAWNTRPWEPLTGPPSPVLAGDAAARRARHKAPGRVRLLPRPRPHAANAGDSGPWETGRGTTAGRQRR